MRWRVILCVLLFFAGGLVGAPVLVAQTENQTKAPGASLRVYLVTFGPGEELWAKFGHDALWIHDPEVGTDLVYNYGMFDFQAAHFYKNFILGTMHYWMAGFDVVPTIEFYESLHRSIWVDELNLTAQQKLSLQQFLQWNALTQNKYYHYDYYLDNCATRVRDALDRVLGGQIKQQTENVLTHTTYRDFTRRDMIRYPFVYTALEFVLGQPVDRPLTEWQQMYLPLHLQANLQHVRVRDARGNLAPLILNQTRIYQGQWPMPLEHTPHPWGWYLALGLAMGILFILLGLAARAKQLHAAASTPSQRWARRLFAVAAVAWTFLLGSAGLFLAWGETFTHHTAVRPNENLLHFCPLAILLIVLIPAMLWNKRPAMRAGWIVLILLVACGAVGLLLKAFPFFYQSNWGLIALTLPANVGLAAGMACFCLHRLRWGRWDDVSIAGQSHLS